LRQRLYSRLLEIDVFSDCVATAGEALEKLDETSYALLIIDVGLTDGGIERIIGRIDRMDRASRPIVLVLAPTAEAARSLDVEVVQIVLRRPVDVRQLVDLVQNCLRTSDRDRPEQSHGDGERRQVTT
jgi:DNA-binding response OmpR family regulator